MLELKVTASVAANNSSTDEYTPTSGEEVTIDLFVGEIPQSRDCVACLLWGSDLIWSIQSGSGGMPFQCTLTGDGVKVLKLEAKNNEDTVTVMSSYVKGRK